MKMRFYVALTLLVAIRFSEALQFRRSPEAPIPEHAPTPLVMHTKKNHSQEVAGIASFYAQLPPIVIKNASLEPLKPLEVPDPAEVAKAVGVEFPATGLAAPPVARYGPDQCVSTWKSSEGHCIVATECDANKLSRYELGIVCVDKKGYPEKHTFGNSSFKTEETFDTLLECDECLGLEAIPSAVVVAGDVATMQSQLDNLTLAMQHMSDSVSRLNVQVNNVPAGLKNATKAQNKTKPLNVTVPQINATQPEATTKFLAHTESEVRYHRNMRHASSDAISHQSEAAQEEELAQDADDETDEAHKDVRGSRDDDTDEVERNYAPFNDVEQTAAEMASSAEDDQDVSQIQLDKRLTPTA